MFLFGDLDDCLFEMVVDVVMVTLLLVPLDQFLELFVEGVPANLNDRPTNMYLPFLIHSPREREMFYLTTHSTHFIYGYMASDIWLRTILIVRKETHCRHISYSYQLTARVLLYAPYMQQTGQHIPHTAFVTPVVEDWLEREITQLIQRNIQMWKSDRSLDAIECKTVKTDAVMWFRLSNQAKSI